MNPGAAGSARGLWNEFFVCPPQPRRDSLGALRMSLRNELRCVPIAALFVSGACYAPANASAAPQLDSAAVARIALAVFDSSRDTAFEFRVVDFAWDSKGAVVTVSRNYRSQPVSRILIAGGGGRVRVRRDGTTKVLEVFQ